MKHDDVARKFADPRHLLKDQIKSAGFVVFSCHLDYSIIVECYGESISLGIR